MSKLTFTILVVDDDRAIRETLTDALTMEGHAVLTAANGAEALSLVEQEPPALLLLDMHMPTMDGQSLMAALREKGIHLPVIVMTAAFPVHSLALELGVHGYLSKPFELDRVLALVGEVYTRWLEARHSPS